MCLTGVLRGGVYVLACMNVHRGVCIACRLAYTTFFTLMTWTGQFHFTVTQLSLVGKRVLRMHSGRRYKSDTQWFVVLAMLYCVRGTQNIFAHAWWTIWQREHAFFSLLQHMLRSRYFSLVPVMPHVYVLWTVARFLLPQRVYCRQTLAISSIYWHSNWSLCGPPWGNPSNLLAHCSTFCHPPSPCTCSVPTRNWSFSQ